MAKTNKEKQCYTKAHRRTSDNTMNKPTRTNNVIHNTSKYVRQYHGQNQQGQGMLYKTHRRTSDNTMAKTNKDKQCNTKHTEERQTIPWPKPTRKNNVIQSTSKNVRQYHEQTNKDKQCNTQHIEVRQTIPWPKPTRTRNVIQNTSKNVRQYHGQNQQGQTMLYKTHRRMSDNTMAKTNKDKLYYSKHIEELQTIPWRKPTRTNNVIQNTSKNVR